jgi:hypothetical protein
MASMTFGPPGWQPVLGQEGADAAAKPPLDHVGQFRGQHDAEAV